MRDTHYDILEVPRDADLSVIGAAYKRLAKATHPDVGGSAALFRAVNAAWETLRDPQSRAAYDRTLNVDGPSADGPEPSPADPPPNRDRNRDRPPRDEQRTRPDRDRPPSGGTATPSRRTSGPAVIGRPTAVDGHGRAGQVGLIGERRVAATLAACDALPPTAFVAHDLVVTESGANVDHVVLHGRSVLLIDTKTWADGTYKSTRRGRVWRTLADGTKERFAHAEGLSDAVGYLFDTLTELLAVPKLRVTRLLVVSSPRSDDTNLDLSRFSVSGMEVLTVDQLDERVRRWVKTVGRIDTDAAASTCPPARVSTAVAYSNHPDGRDSALPVPAQRLPPGSIEVPGRDLRRLRVATWVTTGAHLTLAGVAATAASDAPTPTLLMAAAVTAAVVAVGEWLLRTVTVAGLLPVDVASLMGQTPAPALRRRAKFRAGAAVASTAVLLLAALVGQQTDLLLLDQTGPAVGRLGLLVAVVAAAAVVGAAAWPLDLPKPGPDRASAFVDLVRTDAADEVVNILRWHAAHGSADAAAVIRQMADVSAAGWQQVADVCRPSPVGFLARCRLTLFGFGPSARKQG